MKCAKVPTSDKKESSNETRRRGGEGGGGWKSRKKCERFGLFIHHSDGERARIPFSGRAFIRGLGDIKWVGLWRGGGEVMLSLSLLLN